MHRGFTGIILSGGKNSRIGTNKALLKIDAKEVIQIIFDKMRNLFGEVIVISNEPELYKFLETRIYKDIYPGYGPISGIHSGLINSTTEKNFFISCDMPFVKKELIEYVINFKTEKNIVVPMNNNYVQTLCGIYGKKCLPFLEEKIFNEDNSNEKTVKKQARFSLIRFALDCGAEFIEVSELPFYDAKIFLNINDYEDFEKVRNLTNYDAQKKP